ncbi:MAG TPA: hypothetical protein VMS64_24860 [Candidatus Methylomirabilis sp.]|nr:hypothetical protein [Candidatus Methylomirabilis sp.]
MSTEGSHSLTLARSWPNGKLGWWLVGFVVTLVYVAWTLVTLRHASPHEFIRVGRQFVGASQASPVISGNARRYHYDGDIGFDGQFVYFIAVDPERARYYLDAPAYRYTRILYPLLAGTLALRNPDLVPYTLIGLNLGMIALGTSVLAAWLRRKGASPWLAMVYGFYPGLFIALQRDTTEIMAYSLVALAIYLYDFGTRWRVPASAAVFALSLLARETAAVFAALWAADALLAGKGRLTARMTVNWRPAAVFLGLAVGPLLAWKAVLFFWLGSFGFERVLTPVPFGGAVAQAARHQLDMEQIRTIILPALLCGGAALFALFRGSQRVEIWALLVNVGLCVVFLGAPSFNDISSSGRVTLPVALAAVLCVPYVSGRALGWFWASAALWMAPMVNWLMIPTAKGLLATLRPKL